jgi:hypothetical protein
VIPPAEPADPVVMRFDPQLGLTRLKTLGNGRRRCGRLEQEMLECDLGPVHNLSVGGMRITCRRPPDDEPLTTTIRGLGEPITLRGRVKWTKRIGWRKIEAGIEFIDVTPDLARRLTAIATDHRLRRAM